MSIIREDGGRLNAFGKEPAMEVIEKEAGQNKKFRLLIIGSALVIGCLIAFTVTIS